MSNMGALDTVIESFENAGWNVAAREAVFGRRSVNPTRLTLVRGKQRIALLAYAWNVTHEGRGRTGDNYRIQTTRSHDGNLLLENDRYTVGFGVDHERQVIVAFDGWTKRTAGKSTSVHISRTTLEAAASTGYAEQGPKWDARGAYGYSQGELLISWIGRQKRDRRKAAVQPLDYSISEPTDRAFVLADVWNSAPGIWLRKSDLLVIADGDGAVLLDNSVWEVLQVDVRTQITEGKNPRRTVGLTCRRYGKVKKNHEATFLAGLTKRA